MDEKRISGLESCWDWISMGLWKSRILSHSLIRQTKRIGELRVPLKVIQLFLRVFLVGISD